MFDNDIEECHATFKASESMSPTDRVRLYIKTLLPDAPSAHWLLYLELWPMAARDDDYANLVHNQSLQWINILEEIIDSGINEGEFFSINASVSAQTNKCINRWILEFADPRLFKEKEPLFLMKYMRFLLKSLINPSEAHEKPAVEISACLCADSLKCVSFYFPLWCYPQLGHLSMSHQLQGEGLII